MNIKNLIGMNITDIRLLDYFNTSIYISRKKSNEYILKAGGKTYLVTTRYKKIVECSLCNEYNSYKVQKE